MMFKDDIILRLFVFFTKILFTFKFVITYMIYQYDDLFELIALLLDAIRTI